MGGQVEAGRTYLVTGGAGFIGSNLVHEIDQNAGSVRILDDFSTGRRSNLEGLSDQVEVLEGSVTDRATCKRAVRGVDFVLHQAALPSVPRSIDDPGSTHDTCATGTLNLLLAARDEGVQRFVYASSSSAYGDADTDSKAESLPVKPLSPYAVAKLTGEFYTRIFSRIYGLPTVALRYFNIFGPRQDPNSPYSAVIPLFISHAINGTSPIINGDGDQTRDFTFVSNAVLANLLACNREPTRVSGRVFNVGCGDRVTVNDLWERICRILGIRVEPNYGPARPGDVRDSLASLERSREELGYEPIVSLDEGLRETVAWYRQVASEVA